jgi:hypothetical protein
LNNNIAKGLYYITIMRHNNHEEYVSMSFQEIFIYSQRLIKSRIVRIRYLSFNASSKMESFPFFPSFPSQSNMLSPVNNYWCLCGESPLDLKARSLLCSYHNIVSVYYVFHIIGYSSFSKMVPGSGLGETISAFPLHILQTHH